MAQVPPHEGPFQNLVNVQWAGPIVLIGVAYQGIGAHIIPEDANFWNHHIELKVPSGHESQVFVGRRIVGDNEFFQTSVPSGAATKFSELMMRRVPAAVGVRTEVEGMPDDSVWARPHFVNFHRIFGEFLSELLPDPSEPMSEDNKPDPVRIAYFFGGGFELSSGGNGRARVQVYPAEALKPFQQTDWDYGVNDDYFEYYASRVVSIGGGSPTTAYTLDSMLDCMALPTLPLYSQDYTVGIPGFGSENWDVEWDMFNRTNTEDFPPDGSKPVLVSP